MAEQKKKAIGLISGGLDSALAIKLMQEQDFEVIALHFINPFDPTDNPETGKAAKTAELLGVKMRIIYKGDDFIEIIRHPKHGFGSAINPCIDCRIHLLRQARKVMEEEGAQVLVTGEVLGQRPMSQMRNQMDLVLRKSETEDILLRPLSAKLLPPSRAELDGLIDREKLLDISGRSRRRQLDLAKTYGLEGIQSGGGGCLLTDKIYAKKARDLYEHRDFISRRDYLSLGLGRHFRLDKETKAIVGRDLEENEKLPAFNNDGCLYFEPKNFMGPSVLLEGADTPRNRRKALKLISCYTKPRDGQDTEHLLVDLTHPEGGETEELEFAWNRIDPVELDAWRLT